MLFKKRPPSARTPQDLAMRQVLAVKPKRSFPSWRQWRELPRVLSVFEKRLLQSAIGVFFLSCLTIGGWYVATHRVDTPAVGGDYTEALIGEPQFVNPLYAATSDVDADLARLVYSGLLKWDPKTGGLVNDLAVEFSVSEDGKVYTVKLRDDARFHNGEPVRARDVIFTIEAIQNPLYRSPLLVSFQKVKVTQVDDKTVSFTLDEPFAPFPHALTVGVLPADVWSDIAPRNAPLADLNLRPVGSGPYQFAEFSKDKKGSIRSYTLTRNRDYYGDKTYIETLTFKFYADTDIAADALANRNVEGVSFVPPHLDADVGKNKSVHILRPSMPRETLLFFNQDQQPIFKKAEVRKAIILAIDKTALIEKTLLGHAEVIDSAVPHGMLGEHPGVAKLTFDPTAANALLEAAGYPKVEGQTFRLLKKPATGDPTFEVAPEEQLAFTLTTVQNAEFMRVAELLAEQLAVVGIRLSIETVEPEKFGSSVIEPHSYELLLTGLLLGADADPFPFWHSSQTKSGGLNLAGYANRKADTLLEEARGAIDPNVRAEKYRAFQDLLAEDLPAVFLYQSNYAYAVASKIKNVVLDRIVSPSDRFANISDWYIKTRKTLR